MITSDSVGLGFSVTADTVSVHYLARGVDGVARYGAPLQIDYPFRFPDANAITRERVALIEGIRNA